jgi:hypothetical protein
VGEACCDQCYQYLVIPASTLADRLQDGQTVSSRELVTGWLEWFLNDYLDELAKLDAAKAVWS